MLQGKTTKPCNKNYILSIIENFLHQIMFVKCHLTSFWKMDNLNLIKHFRKECNCEIRTMAIPIIKQGSCWHWSYGRDHT